MTKVVGVTRIGKAKGDARSGTDADLVLAAQRGDLQAFSRLVERHRAVVTSFAYALTGSFSLSEEVAQEAFAQAWERLVQLRERARFRGWVFGLARNAARGARRREADVTASSMKSFRWESEIPSSDPSPLESVISREEQLSLLRALSLIPEKYRIPLVLFYREGKDLDTVAQALELTTNAVAVRLSRGRKILQQELLRVVESAMARRRPRKDLIAAVTAATAAQGQAVDAARAAGREPRSDPGAGWSSTAARMLATAVPAACLMGYMLFSSTANTRPAVPHRSRADVALAGLAPTMGAGRKPLPPVFEDAPSNARAPDVEEAAHLDEIAIINFDFEEGVMQPLFRMGHVAPCPAGSPSQFCAIGTVNLNWPKLYAIEMTTDSLGISYSRQAVISFDYWNGHGDGTRGRVIAVEVFNMNQNRNYAFWLGGYAARTWHHAELPLSTFVLSTPLRDSPEERDRRQQEGDRIKTVSIYGGLPGGEPIFIDNLKLSMVAPHKQKDPGPAIPKDPKAPAGLRQ